MTPTPTAELMRDWIHSYHTDRIEKYVGSRTVMGIDNQPRVKHYYRKRICADVMSFYQFWQGNRPYPFDFGHQSDYDSD